MKILKKPVPVVTLMVVALLLAAPASHAASDKDVRVINTAAEAIPTVAQGTTTIAGTVNLAPGTTVNVAGAAQQPFAATVGSVQPNLTNVSTATLATVPAGKRLVIEFVTMTGQVPPGQFAEIMEITTNAGSGGISHPLVIHAQPPAVIGDSVFRSNQDLRLYATGGSNVTVLFRRTSSAGQATFFATISGYLVDAP